MMRCSASFMPRLRSASGLSRAAILIAPRPHVKRSGNDCADVVAANALLDTGAILAILDRTDRWHEACVAAIDQLRLPLMTSEAVLTELFHLVGDSRAAIETAWKFVRSGALVVASIENGELPHVHTLMSRYWDRPMDFADATLVFLAKRESLSTILTVDRADFETYRIDGKRRFRILPAAPPRR